MAMDNQNLALARQLLNTEPRERIWHMWVLARALELDHEARAPKSRAVDPKRYDSLLNEAMARIPTHTPQWTDHHANDPGITLLDLFAYLAELGDQFNVPRRGLFRRLVCRWLCR